MFMFTRACAGESSRAVSILLLSSSKHVRCPYGPKYGPEVREVEGSKKENKKQTKFSPSKKTSKRQASGKTQES